MSIAVMDFLEKFQLNICIHVLPTRDIQTFIRHHMNATMSLYENI